MKFSSWNPFSCQAATLPPNLVLTAKLIFIGLVGKGYYNDLSDHFLPVIGIFEKMGPPAVFTGILKITFWAAGVSLLLNRGVRNCCLILGILFLIVPLSSQLSYSNAKILCGCIFLLIGLHPGGPPWLIRVQLALIYFGAGFNKLLEPDWLSGQYFEYWMHQIIGQKYYVLAASWFPAMTLSQIMGWLTITVELGLSAGFLIPRWYPVVIRVGILFHAVSVLLAQRDFGIFYGALMASYLSCVAWPKSSIVFYNDKNTFWRVAGAFWKRIDFDGIFRWRGMNELPQNNLTPTENLCLEQDGRRYIGFQASKRGVLYTPFPYFVLVFCLVFPQEEYAKYRYWAVFVFMLVVPLADVALSFLGWVRRRYFF